MERPLEYDEEHREINITRSSRHSTIQNQKIANQIDLLVGKEISELKENMQELTNLCERLKMKVIDNANEVQINREKLFLFMRGEKSNTSTQNNLIKSIKQGIKQAAHNTSKELNTSFFTKFHSPREDDKVIHARADTNKGLTNNIGVTSSFLN